MGPQRQAGPGRTPPPRRRPAGVRPAAVCDVRRARRRHPARRLAPRHAAGAVPAPARLRPLAVPLPLRALAARLRCAQRGAAPAPTPADWLSRLLPRLHALTRRHAWSVRDSRAHAPRPTPRGAEFVQFDASRVAAAVLRLALHLAVPPGTPLASEEWPSASLPAGLSSFLSDEGRTLPPVGLSPPTKAARTRPGCARALAVTTWWLSCGLVCPRLATQARPTRCSTWRCGTSPATAPPSCTTRSRCCTRCCARGPVRQPASLEAPLATSRLRRPRLIRVLPRAAMAHTTAPHGGSCPRLVESPASPASPRVALGRTRSIPQT